MRHTTLVALVTGGILFLSLSGTPANAQDTAARIKEATSIFVGTPDPSVTPAQVRTALLAVLDITASVCPASPHQAEILDRIGIARELIGKDSIFNDKARQYLAFAYRMLTDGKKYEPPADLDQFVTPSEAQEKARAHAARLVEAAVGDWNGGRPAETARQLLELVLMIVTPIKG